MKSNIELSEKRVTDAKKRLAKCLNMLETTSQELKWACEAESWNEEVVFQIDDAATKLGFALATLTNWDDECEGDDE